MKSAHDLIIELLFRLTDERLKRIEKWIKKQDATALSPISDPEAAE